MGEPVGFTPLPYIYLFQLRNVNLKLKTMKKVRNIIIIVVIIGQMLSLIGLIIAESSSQFMCGITTFLMFGSVGVIALISKPN
jgi:hypothetical protein